MTKQRDLVHRDIHKECNNLVFLKENISKRSERRCGYLLLAIWWANRIHCFTWSIKAK